MRATLVLLCLTLTGCLQDVDNDRVLTVGILGDSNSAPGWSGFPMWGDLLPLQGHVLTFHAGGAAITPMLGVSKAAGGATKLDHSDVIAWQYAPQQLAALPPVDVIVAAFITNDVLWGATPADLLACFQALAKEISATRPGTAFFVATAPPRWDRYAQDVATVNATLRAVWPPRFLVDFDTGFGQSLFIDAVHVSVAGQQLRARRAYEAFLR